MNKYILLLVLFGMALMPMPFNTEYQSPAIDGDVFIGGQLPYWGEVCESTPVYGGPDAEIYPTFGMVQAGEIVTLRELSKPVGDWVMIQRARWIPLSAVCNWNK